MSAGGQSPLKRALRVIEDLQSRLAALEESRHEPIAVIGIGCRVPGGGEGPDEFWDMLRAGRDAVTEVPHQRWDLSEYYDPDPDAPGKTYTRWGGFLESVDGFDPQFFGIAPREASDMDPQQRLLLEVAWEALEHAGQAPDRLEGTRTGVYVGLCSGDFARLSPWTGEGAKVSAYSASGIAHSVASGRISYFLGLRGPAVTVDTACSSSLVAIHLACLSLRAGDCRMAMAGGVHLMLSPDNTIAFCRTKMMSPVGRCKAFAAGADGFVLGEGCGVVVLKKLSDAKADGDRILAVIRGTAANQDGSSGGLTVPSGKAQADVIRDALADARLAPRDVVYVETHGTGTSLGDPIEARALASVLGEGRDAADPLLIGSVKTNIGHLEAAAGVTGLIKTVLALQKGFIPPHLHAETLSPHIPWDEIPVIVPVGGCGWPEGRRRIAGVSGFGFSGTNIHLIVESAEEEVSGKAGDDRPAHILTVSARTPGALRALAAGYAERISSGTVTVADAAYTANACRAHGLRRRAIIARSAGELVESLMRVAAGKETEREISGDLASDDAPRIVFMFTGQGAQSTGMGRKLYETQPTFRNCLDHCADILRPVLDRRLLDLLFEPGDAARLEQTAYTQPALFSLEYALAQLWQAWGLRPAAVMGHSLGEFVAACVAGVMTLEEGLSLVAERGRLMQGLSEPGAMAAVLAEEERVAEAVARGAGRLSIAAVNAPRNVVVSGDAACVESLCGEMARGGVTCKRLFVSHAFHSPLMDPILDAFRTFAGKFSFASPCVPLVSNVTGHAFGPGEVPDRDYWARHLRSPVRFADSVAGLLKKGYRFFLEIGPRPTLSTLGKMAEGAAEAMWLPSLRDGHDDWDTMLGSLAVLYSRGGRVDWRGFDGDYRRRLADLPTYPFERGRYRLERRRSIPAASVSVRPASHPLIGSPIASPALKDFVSESNLSAVAPAFIGEHKVFGAVIMPAAGFIEMAMAAGKACGRGAGGSLLRDFVIHEAMAFGEGETKVVQTVVEKGGEDGAGRLRIYSAGPGAGGDIVWRLHASGRLASSRQDDGSQEGLERAKRRCLHVEDLQRFRAALTDRGIDLGPRYGCITALWTGDGEALSRITASATVAGEGKPYLFHPVLLDACLQTMGGALGIGSGGASQDVFLPLSVDLIEAKGSPQGDIWCHASLDGRVEKRGDSITGRVYVYDGEGRRIAAMEGLVLKRTDPAVFSRLTRRLPDETDRWLYEPAWEPSPVRPAGGERSVLSGFDSAATLERLATEVEKLAKEHGFIAYPEAEDMIDEAGAGFIADAMGRLGVRESYNGRLEIPALVSVAGVAPRFTRLLHRFFAILEERGYAEKREDGWRLLRRAKAVTPPSEACMALAREFPALVAEIETLRRCGPFLAEVLKGEKDPLHLLFPGGATEGADALYRRSAASLMYNGLAAKIVREAAEGAGDKAIRILEIGGGTGGTTAHLLPILPEGRYDYLFTDISPFFTARAAGEFGRHREFRSRTLDIERSPGEQGFAGEKFDIVICANVLHATRDLSVTLANVRSLLAPSGLLVLVEVVRPLCWVDVTFGLTEGWWRFDDGEIRSDYPLLSAKRWDDLLSSSGFEGIAALPAAGSDAERRYGEVVLVARMPVERKPSGGVSAGRDRWLLLADRGGVAERLSARLREDGGACTLVRPGGYYARNADGSVMVDPLSREDFRTLLASGSELEGAWTGVLHLWALDSVPASGMTVESIGKDVSRICGGTLHLMQAMAELPDPPRLWLVTRGARSAIDGGMPVQASQSLMCGLGRSAGLEHPEWKCTNVDLSPEGGTDDVENLLAEIAGGGDEDSVSWRADGRYVERLARRGDGAADPETDGLHAGSYSLEIGRRGVLDNLRWQETERRAPEQGHVEIEVEATGLNFRDVLNAMGLYPGSPPPFGSECAGRITATGNGAGDFMPGDPVVAIAPGSFGRHVTVPASFVCKRPRSLTAAEAVTIPVAGVTASFSLEHVAALAPGERVLIHSAAGGVGLAAVRIAMRIGAEVFATAGTHAKREFLRRIGVRLALDSRTATFGKEILDATGGAGVHVVLNSLSGDAIPAGLSALVVGGRFIELGKRGAWDPEKVKAVRPDVRYEQVDWGATAQADPGLVAGIFRNVMESAFDGGLEIPPFRSFPASRVVEAFRCMNQGRHLGKIVIVHPRRRVEPPGIRPDGAYLVTGGFGGIGLLSAGWLADGGARNIVLLGRHGPDEEASRKIRDMEAAGATVRKVAGDVSDSRFIGRLISELADGIPPFRGIIHSAGTLGDGVIRQQDWPRFESVFAAKVAGTWNLHAATAGIPLDFFVMYSSIASVFGSAGQSNHAAANAFLDAVAHHRRALGLPGVSIDWGSWAEVGAGARHGVGARLEKQGIGEIPPAAGLGILGRLLDPERPQVVVTPVDWPSFFRHSRRAGTPFFSRMEHVQAMPEPPAAEAAKPATWREELSAIPPGNRRAILESRVMEKAIKVLGLPGDTAVDVRRPLQEMGLDSLMAIELRNALSQGIGETLPSTLLFDHPTIEAIVEVLVPHVGAGGAAASAADEGKREPEADVTDVVSKIEELSDDEVDRLLARHMKKDKDRNERPD